MTEAAPLPSGGLPWEMAIPIGVALGGAIAALWRNRVAAGRHFVEVLREKDAALESARREGADALEKAERRADDLDRSFREHLEHDNRVFRGERDRRDVPRHTTGKQDLDERRDRAERNSRQIPPDLLARIRESIDRGEDPLGGSR